MLGGSHLFRLLEFGGIAAMAHPGWRSHPRSSRRGSRAARVGARICRSGCSLIRGLKNAARYVSLVREKKKERPVGLRYRTKILSCRWSFCISTILRRIPSGSMTVIVPLYRWYGVFRKWPDRRPRAAIYISEAVACSCGAEGSMSPNRARFYARVRDYAKTGYGVFPVNEAIL